MTIDEEWSALQREVLGLDFGFSSKISMTFEAQLLEAQSKLKTKTYLQVYDWNDEGDYRVEGVRWDDNFFPQHHRDSLPYSGASDISCPCPWILRYTEGSLDGPLPETLEEILALCAKRGIPAQEPTSPTVLALLVRAGVRIITTDEVRERAVEHERGGTAGDCDASDGFVK